MLYTAAARTTVPTKERLTLCFYDDSGASDNLIPWKGDLYAYREFEQPVKVAAANNGKIYAYGTGSCE